MFETSHIFLSASHLHPDGHQTSTVVSSREDTKCFVNKEHGSRVLSSRECERGL